MRKPQHLLQMIISLLLCLALLTACGAKSRPASEETAQTEQATVAWDGIVAQFGNHSLTNVGFNYYYWSSITSFLNYHGSDTQKYFDLYSPLDQQYYSEELTWQDYFISDALMAFKQYSVINDIAASQGFTLSETAQNTLANAEEELQGTAEAMGFETIQEYLVGNYGEGATLESYLSYIHDQFVVREYTASIQDSFDYTDEEIEAYYDENKDSYIENGIFKDDVKMAQLRYLMILPEEQTDENYEIIDAAFDEMLADWEAWEDKSEKGFMSFGEKWSEKGFAQDYLDAVAPNTVEFSYFDDWVFGEPRQLGDTRTYYKESGDYMFFYVGQTDEIFWRKQVKYDMCHESFTNTLLNEMANYTFSVHEENIVIAQTGDLYTDGDDLAAMIEEME